MSGFLLDTNIPSELTRQKSAAQVERWLDEANDEELHFSVISLGEILRGITVPPASKRRDGLQEWLDVTLRPWFENRILPVTAPIAERWGVLSGECRLQGTTGQGCGRSDCAHRPPPQTHYRDPERERLFRFGSRGFSIRGSIK
jgi:predicted nucleic acid-binding protein